MDLQVAKLTEKAAFMADKRSLCGPADDPIPWKLPRLMESWTFVFWKIQLKLNNSIQNKQETFHLTIQFLSNKKKLF